MANTNEQSSTTALNFDDLNDIFPTNSWDNFDSSPTSEEPTTTVDSIGLSTTNQSINSPLNVASGVRSTTSFSGTATHAYTVNSNSTSAVASLLCNSIGQVNNSMPTVGDISSLSQQQSSTTFGDNDDKLRNLLTNSASGNGGLISNDDSFTLSQPQHNMNNKKIMLQSLGSSGGSSNDILRELLDNEDITETYSKNSQMSGGNGQHSMNNVTTCNSVMNSNSSVSACSSNGSVTSFAELLGDNRNVKKSLSGGIMSSTTTSINSNTNNSNTMLRMLLNDDECVLKSNGSGLAPHKTSNESLVDQLFKEDPNNNNQQQSSLGKYFFMIFTNKPTLLRNKDYVDTKYVDLSFHSCVCLFYLLLVIMSLIVFL